MSHDLSQPEPRMRCRIPASPTCTAMKTPSLFGQFTRLLCAALALAALAAPASAQQMPQDHWRYDGLQFSSPTPSNYLYSIATGSGGVYAGESNGAGGYSTSVLQFTEGGVFVRCFTSTFTNILGIACDSDGNVYVLDGGASMVKVFDQNGTFLRQWGAAGTGDGQFGGFNVLGVNMVAVDKNNQIYVCDPSNTRVQVFDSNGAFLRKWGQQGTLPSQFKSGNPTAIACSPTGEIFVQGYGYTGDPSIKVFTGDGTFKRSGNTPNYYGGGEGFNSSADGLILFADFSNGSLRVFDAYFSELAGANSIGNFGGSTFGSLAISKRGNVFVLSNRTQIVVYEREYSNVQNSLLPPAIPQPIVLAAAQRAGTSWMDIDYQVTDADSATVTTALLAFKNGGTTLTDAVVMSTFQEGTGANVGLNIATGVSKHLTWNMAADWTVDFAQVQVEALAKDSRSLLGIHWITVPASGGNPAIQVSAGPITDGVLLDVWFWLVARHQPGIALSNGTVNGTANPYNNTALASGAATTGAGRSYLYGLMGVRAITAVEIAQAQGGSYGFSSVDANSVVKLP